MPGVSDTVVIERGRATWRERSGDEGALDARRCTDSCCARDVA